MTLINSGAMESFIDYQTVAKLRLEVTKIPQPQKIYNVDGMENQAGLIKHCVHLYIKHKDRQTQAKFFVTNLGKEQIILEYPWLEEFNLEINWRDGKLLGSHIQLKTLAVVAKEQLATHIWQIEVKELRKTTVAQHMAEKYLNKPKTTIISLEYQIYAKVFSEKEAK